MENLKIGDDPLNLNTVINAMKESPYFTKLLDNWKGFARNLGVHDAKILHLADEVILRKVKLDDVPYELIRYWRGDTGNGASLQALCNALVNSKMSDISEVLERKFWTIAAKSLNIKLHDKVFKLGEFTNISEKTHRHIYDAIKKTTFNQPIDLLKNDVIPKVYTKYYVPRTLSYKSQVDERIFKAYSNENQLLLVKGISKSQLAKVSGFQAIDVSGNQLYDITVKLILLEQDEDYDKICQRTANPVHLIEYRNETYFWIKSKNGLGTIRYFILEQKDSYSEDELTNILACTTRSVSISDSPGMGKTFLSQSLATKFKATKKSTVILFVLYEFIERIKNLQIHSSSLALSAILNYAFANEPARLILEEIFKNEDYRIDLFLDGYDEVSPDKLDIVDSFLTHIKAIKNARVLVTTRPHLKFRIEGILNELSYEILPFDESNQVQFLSKYWIHQHRSEQGERVERYAQRCLQTLHGQMTDNESKIAGTPLQCRLLAEVYAEDAERASKLDLESTEVIKITSLFDMYRSLVELKFQRLPEDSKNRFSFSYWRKQNYKSNYINAHVHDSFLLLFPDWIEKFKPSWIEFDQIDENIIYSIGLIEKSPYKNTPRFVHRTFAEYQLAEFLVKHLSKHSGCAELVYGHILGGNGVEVTTYGRDPINYFMKQPVITYFVNMQLKDQIKYSPLDEMALNLAHFRNKILFENVCQAIALCSSHDFETSFDLSIKLFHHLRMDHDNPEYLILMRDKYFKILPMQTIKASKSITLIDKLFDFTANQFKVDLSYHLYENDNITPNYPWFSGCTPLHMAVTFGKYNVVTYLVDRYHDQMKKLRCLVHMCVRNTSESSDSIIESKLSIIDLLADIAKKHTLDWFNTKYQDRTPLLEIKVHLKLLQQLVKRGSNINSCSPAGTVLHTEGCFDKFDALVTWAFSSGFTLTNYSDSEGKTPLMKAMGHKVVLDKVLEVFHDAQTDFNAQDLNGNSILFYAITTQSTAIINKIIDFGANVNHTNSKKRNVAHVMMKRRSNLTSTEVLERLRILITKGYNLLNQPDADEVISFELMITSSSLHENPELFELYHMHGVNFNRNMKIFDVRGKVCRRVPPLYSICWISFESFEKIIQYADNYNYVDHIDGCNAAHAAMRNAEKSGMEPKEIIRCLNLLISKGFKRLDHHNKQGITPLQLALRLKNFDLNLLNFFHENGAKIPGGTKRPMIFTAIISHQSLAIIKKLVEYGSEINSLGCQGENALHVAAYSSTRNFHVLEYLTTIFGSNSTDKQGQTPLHFALCEMPGKYKSMPNGLRQEPMDLKLLQFYHEHGADFNAGDLNGNSVLFYAIRYTFGRTFAPYMQLNQKLYGFARVSTPVDCMSKRLKEGIKVIRKLLEYDANPNHVNMRKENAAHIAIKSWDLPTFSKELMNLLELLLKNGFTKIDEKDGVGYTPFLLWFEQSKGDVNEEILNFFYNNGADFNEADPDGYSVLFKAIAYYKDCSVINKILDCGANLYHRDEKNKNLLHIAAYTRVYPAVKFMIDKFDINSVDVYGRTALQYLLVTESNVDLKLVELFHSRGANFNAADNEGNPVLFYAIRSGQNETILKKILQYGVGLNNPFERSDTLHCAAYLRHLSALQLLIGRIDINSLDENGRTPLHYLFDEEKPLDANILDLFYVNGANFNAVDKNNVSVLFRAIEANQNAVIIAQIMKYGGDPYHIHNNSNALMWAAQVANTCAVEFLLKKCDDINAVNSLGELPLHKIFSVSGKDYRGVLKMLLEKGSKFDIENNQGHIPLVNWIIDGKEPLPTLLELQDLLPITSDIACIALATLVKHESFMRQHLINASEQKSESFRNFLILLTNKLDSNFVPTNNIFDSDETIYSTLGYLTDQFDLNSVDEDGLTPLHQLLEMTNSKVINSAILDLFFQKGANFNAVDNEGDSVLIYAIRNNQNALFIRKMLECGADVFHLTSEKATALHIAAFHRNISVLGLLIDMFDTNSIDEKGETPLHYLVSEEDPLDLKLLELFHSKGADFNATDNDDFSVIFHAISSKQNSVVIQKLIEYGCDVDHCDSQSGTALHFAAYQRNYSALEFLIDRIEIDSEDENGRTPLHQLFADEEPLESKFLDLFQEKGANFNAVDDRECSAIMFALQSNQNGEIITKLVDCGSDLQHSDDERKSILHFAAQFTNKSALEFLIDKIDINIVDSNEQTPLHFLVSTDESLDLELLQIFFENGADFNASNKFGSVLFFAIEYHQNATTLRKLIQYGADPNFVNSDKQNALQVAVAWANYSALELLLDKFEDINLVDNEGNTPLHEAFLCDDLDYSAVLKLLLKKGANFDIRNSKGHIPLVKWVIEGNNPLPTLLKLQNILPITKDIASTALTALIQQEILIQKHLINSSSSEEDKEVFMNFFNLLRSKGGKLHKSDGSEIVWTNVSSENAARLDHVICGNQDIQLHFSEPLKHLHGLSDEINFSFLHGIEEDDVPVELFLEVLLISKQYNMFQALCKELDVLVLQN